MNNSAEFSRLPLWHAQYGAGTTIINPVTRVNYGGWTEVSIHQYTSTKVLCNRVRDHNYLLKPLPGMELEDDMTPAEVQQIVKDMVPDIVRHVVGTESIEVDDRLREVAIARERLRGLASDTDPKRVLGALEALRAAGYKL